MIQTITQNTPVLIAAIVVIFLIILILRRNDIKEINWKTLSVKFNPSTVPLKNEVKILVNNVINTHASDPKGHVEIMKFFEGKGNPSMVIYQFGELNLSKLEKAGIIRYSKLPSAIVSATATKNRYQVDLIKKIRLD